ncbi:MAG: alpha-glucosidase C-terminal domain-containing protein [Candidatus Sumerlaeaceae bacterium]|nr:alpha-glucosidase C-terminal domain-containing protein [Candidatus Sumerlaeaceae bacterium]
MSARRNGYKTNKYDMRYRRILAALLLALTCVSPILAAKPSVPKPPPPARPAPGPESGVFEPVPTITLNSGTSAVIHLADYANVPVSSTVNVRANRMMLAVPGPGPLDLTVAASLKPGLTPLDCRVGTHTLTLLVKTVHRPSHTFRFKPKNPVKKVYVAGSFNGWNSTADALEGPSPDGSYALTRQLDPGTYRYKFVADGNWLADDTNPDKEPDGHQGFNSTLHVSGNTAGLPPRLLQESTKPYDAGSPEGNGSCFEFAVDPGATTSPLDAKSVIVMDDNSFLRDAKVTLKDNKLSVCIPGGGKGLIRINARTTDGFWARETAFYPSERLATARNQWRQEVVYFVFTDRFLNGDPANDNKTTDPELAPLAAYQGGDWAGIRKKIEDGYFEKLGVTTLWISPVVRNAEGAWTDAVPPHHKFSSYHGYWPVAPRETNQWFGSLDDLKDLVQTAHQHNIRILVDCVANHVHTDHPYYKQHPEWFGPVKLPDGTLNLRKFDDFPLTTWFDTFLPKFDYLKAPDALKAQVEEAIWWIDTVKFDGFRHDATKHIPHEFWRALTTALKTRIEQPRQIHAYQVGESIIDRAKLMEYVNPGELDGQFDFPLYWTIRSAFATETEGFDKLDQSLQASIDSYGPWSMNSAILGNHDFGRFMAFADGSLKPEMDEKEFGWNTPPVVHNQASYEKLKNAFTFLLTLPFVPTIYYGDEIGMTGGGDPDNRRVMRFGKDLTAGEQSVLDHVSRLTAIRKAHPALQSGDYTPLLAEQDVFVYLRSDFRERLLVAFNRESKPRRVEVAIPAWVGAKAQVEKLSGGANANRTAKGLSLTMPPESASIFILR